MVLVWRPPVCITCIHLLPPHVCMWYIVMVWDIHSKDYHVDAWDLKPPYYQERGNDHIWVYLSFVQHQKPDMLCNPWITSLNRIDAGIIFKDPKYVSSKSLEMNMPQTYKGFGFLGWMDERYVTCNNPLSIHHIPTQSCTSPHDFYGLS